MFMSHTKVMDKPDKIYVRDSLPKGKRPKLRLISYSSTELRRLRKELHITQKELADCLEVTPGMVSHFENDDRPESPNFKQLTMMGKLFSDKAGYKIVLFADHEYGKTPQEYWGV